MTMAKTVEGCLERHYLPYSVIFHSRALCSRDTAQAAAVPAERIAKAVLLADANGYVMAVVPGDSHVVVDVISREFAGAAHDEAAWRARLALPLEFLLGAPRDPAR